MCVLLRSTAASRRKEINRIAFPAHPKKKKAQKLLRSVRLLSRLPPLPFPFPNNLPNSPEDSSISAHLSPRIECERFLPYACLKSFLPRVHVIGRCGHEPASFAPQQPPNGLPHHRLASFIPVSTISSQVVHQSAHRSGKTAMSKSRRNVRFSHRAANSESRRLSVSDVSDAAASSEPRSPSKNGNHSVAPVSDEVRDNGRSA